MLFRIAVRPATGAALLFAALLPLLLLAPPAHAVRESSRATKMDTELHVELALHVQHREQALTALFDAAARHAADKGLAPTGSRPSATPATSPTWSTSCRSTTTTSRPASG